MNTVKNLDEKFIVGFAKSYVDRVWGDYSLSSERLKELKEISSSFEVLGSQEWYPDVYLKVAMRSFNNTMDTKFRQKFIDHVIDYAGAYITHKKENNPNISYVDITKSLNSQKIYPEEKIDGYDVDDPLDYYLSFLNRVFASNGSVGENVTNIKRDIYKSTASIICLEEIHKAQQGGIKIEGVPNVILNYRDGATTLEKMNYMIRGNAIGLQWTTSLELLISVTNTKKLEYMPEFSALSKIPFLGKKIIENMLDSDMAGVSWEDKVSIGALRKNLLDPIDGNEEFMEALAADGLADQESRIGLSLNIANKKKAMGFSDVVERVKKVFGNK